MPDPILSTRRDGGFVLDEHGLHPFTGDLPLTPEAPGYVVEFEAGSVEYGPPPPGTYDDVRPLLDRSERR